MMQYYNECYLKQRNWCEIQVWWAEN